MLKRDSERKTPLVVGMEDVDRYEKEATLQDTLATLIQTDAEVTINYKYFFFSLLSSFTSDVVRIPKRAAECTLGFH